MRQRNDTHDELVAWVDPVLVIGPGDVIEWDSPLVGLTILQDDRDEPQEAGPEAKDSDDDVIEEITP